MSKSKLLSLFVGVFYLIAFVLLGGRSRPLIDVVQGIAALLICLALSLPLIWFSDDIGPFLGRGRSPELQPNWAFFISFAGWLMLLLPAIIFAYNKIT